MDSSADDPPKPRKKPVGFAKLSKEELARYGRMGGLTGRHHLKGFASMTKERRAAAARIGHAKRKTRYQFSERDRIISGRITAGDTREQAEAYADTALKEPTGAELYAARADAERDAVAEIAAAAGHTVETPDTPESKEAERKLAMLKRKKKAPPGGAVLPIPETSKLDPEILARLDQELATACSIRDKHERAAKQIEIGEMLRDATEARHAKLEAERIAKRNARLTTVLEKRARLGLDDSDLINALGLQLNLEKVG